MYKLINIMGVCTLFTSFKHKPLLPSLSFLKIIKNRVLLMHEKNNYKQVAYAVTIEPTSSSLYCWVKAL